MSPLRARMIEDMILAGLAVGTQKNYVQAVADWLRIIAARRISSRGRGAGLPARLAPARGGTRHLPDQPVTAFVSSTATRSAGPGLCSGKKGSPRRYRSGCLTRCRRIRSGSCSAASATRSTRRASPSCMRAACASARPPRWRSVPSTGPTRCCASSARATRSGWCRCHSRFSTTLAACGGPITIAAGCSPIGGRCTDQQARVVGYLRRRCRCGRYPARGDPAFPAPQLRHPADRERRRHPYRADPARPRPHRLHRHLHPSDHAHPARYTVCSID